MLMVFVTFVITLLFIFIFSILTNLKDNAIDLTNWKNIYQHQTLINMLVVLILIICFVKLYEVTFFILGIFFFLSYFQAHVWVLTTENILLRQNINIRTITLKTLIQENYTITLDNALFYLKQTLYSEVWNFKELLTTTTRDIQVGIFNVDMPNSISPRLLEIQKIQKKYFKYRKVKVLTPRKTIKDPKEILKLQIFWEKARNPKIWFSLVQRLPWNFKYIVTSSTKFKIITQNVLVIYNFFRTTILALILAFIYFLYTIFFFKIQFLKQLAVWFVIGMIYFWLISGFNFFLKRYQFGKFTSQIQRFWKRTNMIFWLIEGFLILLFFYYFLNSSQEPLYMYDYAALNQDYLVSLHTIGTNIILLSVVIYFMYFVLLRINSNSWTQIALYLVLISTFIFFSFFIETYQFYYVISSFNERLWTFLEEENMWALDIENPTLRTKTQYLLVCLIAKYWHFLFIFLSWVFFLIKSFEKKSVSYVLFGANLQNVIILYVLNFACYLQWSKWIYRRFFDLPYNWFYINIDNKFIFRLFFEIKLIFRNLITFNLSSNSYTAVVHKSNLIWNVDSLCIWKFL